MVTGRVIHDFGGGRVGVSVHLDDEIAVVNAILAFVEQDVGIGWTRINHLAHAMIRQPLSAVAPITAITVGGVRVGAIAADPVTHGHAADARHALTGRLNGVGCVGGAVPDGNRVSAIGPHDSRFDCDVGVPVFTRTRIYGINIAFDPYKGRAIGERQDVAVVLGI